MCRYINLLYFSIPSYGLLLCTAFFVTGFFILQRAKSLNILFEDMIIIMAVSIGTSIIFGELLYILVTYTPEQIMKNIMTANFSFLKHSGLVFYGGLIGGILGALSGAALLHTDIKQLELAAEPILPLGYSIGRIGCIMAGCCYGFEYSGIFAVRNIYTGGTYFPVQIIDIVFNLIIMHCLFIMSRKKIHKYALLCFYLEAYSAARFFLEFFRGDSIRGSYLFFSTSQWIALMILLLCCIISAVQKITEDKKINVYHLFN